MVRVRKKVDVGVFADAAVGSALSYRRGAEYCQEKINKNGESSDDDRPGAADVVHQTHWEGQRVVVHCD